MEENKIPFPNFDYHVEYYKNGNQKSECTIFYQDTVLMNDSDTTKAYHVLSTRSCDYWHENGQKMKHEEFLKGKKNGKCLYWNQEGKLIKTEVWDNGSLIKSE